MTALQWGYIRRQFPTLNNCFWFTVKLKVFPIGFGNNKIIKHDSKHKTHQFHTKSRKLQESDRSNQTIIHHKCMTNDNLHQQRLSNFISLFVVSITTVRLSREQRNEKKSSKGAESKLTGDRRAGRKKSAFRVTPMMDSRQPRAVSVSLQSTHHFPSAAHTIPPTGNTECYAWEAKIISSRVRVLTYCMHGIKLTRPTFHLTLQAYMSHFNQQRLLCSISELFQHSPAFVNKRFFIMFQVKILCF